MSEQKRSKSGGTQPISRHPLFPAIVALWCGALFGAGSIALPPALIEHLVTALGIDHVLPMAAPPLGSTARILIALAMTGLGAAAGVLAARRLTAREPQMHHRRRGVAPAAEEGTAKDEAPAPAGRRRTLAPAAPIAAGDADQPAGNEAGKDKRILNVADFEIDRFDDAVAEECAPAVATPEPEAFIAEEDVPIQALTSGKAAAFAPSAEAARGNLFENYSRGLAVGAQEAQAAPSVISEPDSSLLPDLHHAEEANGMNAPSPAFRAGNTAPPLDAERAHEEPAAPHAGRMAAERIAAAQLDELSPIELLERLALAMEQRREKTRHAAAVPVEPPAQFIEGIEAEPEIVTATGPAEEDGPEEAVIEEQPFEPLPFLQPRLQAAPAALAEKPAAEAEPEPGTALPRIPAALRPVNFDDLSEDDYDDALPAYIPPRHIGSPAAEATAHAGIASFTPPAIDDEEEEADEEEDRVLGEGYSSLLDLSRPLVSRENPIQQFIGAEDTGVDGDGEPVVMFPGDYAREQEPFAAPEGEAAAIAQAAPHDGQAGDRLFDGPGTKAPADTEEALRSALAALQRMSGAA